MMDMNYLFLRTALVRLSLAKQKIAVLPINDIAPNRQAFEYKKHVINNNEGDKQASDFTIGVTGNQPTQPPLLAMKQEPKSN